MSDSDSFIEEVTEEVKRDKLFALMRKYGWIAVVLVLLIVGGTAWREVQKAQVVAEAQDFGDAMLGALEAGDVSERVAALDAVAAPGPGGDAVLQMLIAAEEGTNGDDAAAVARLQALAENAEVPQIYRQIASYKALARGSEVLSVEERRTGLEALAVPGQPLRVLAEEQLAFLEIETGARADALARLEVLVEDSEATAGLRRRATQLIVALGGELPEAVE